MFTSNELFDFGANPDYIQIRIQEFIGSFATPR